MTLDEWRSVCAVFVPPSWRPTDLICGSAQAPCEREPAAHHALPTAARRLPVSFQIVVETEDVADTFTEVPRTCQPVLAAPACCGQNSVAAPRRGGVVDGQAARAKGVGALLPPAPRLACTPPPPARPPSPRTRQRTGGRRRCALSPRPGLPAGPAGGPRATGRSRSLDLARAPRLDAAAPGAWAAAREPPFPLARARAAATVHGAPRARRLRRWATCARERSWLKRPRAARGPGQRSQPPTRLPQVHGRGSPRGASRRVRASGGAAAAAVGTPAPTLRPDAAATLPGRAARVARRTTSPMMPASRRSSSSTSGSCLRSRSTTSR